MGYSFTEADLAFLFSPDGERALAVAGQRTLSPATMLADVAALRASYAPYEAALIETVTCRRRAVGKLADAARIFASDDAVQQATASAVAADRAAELAAQYPGAIVHDVTCSIGAELMELTRREEFAALIGSDIDPVRLRMAQANLSGRATLIRADALAPVSTADVVIADPARRSGAGRVFRMDQLTPPLPEVLAAYVDRPLIVKCAPGLDYRVLRERFGFVGQVQITSLDGGVREACLWTRPGSEAQQRATVLRTSADGEIERFEVADTEPDDVDAGEVGEWIIDPDGAIVRAGLVRQYAHRHGLSMLDPQIAYLTGDSVPVGERGFKVLEVVGTGDKVLRKALASHDCGALEILVRGLDVNPDELRKRLRLKGERSMSLIMTRIGRKGVALICEAGVRF